MYDPGLNAALLRLFAAGRWLTGRRGGVHRQPAAGAGAALAVTDRRPAAAAARRPEPGRDACSASRLVLTLYRHLEVGPHADWEIGRHLAAVQLPPRPPAGRAARVPADRRRRPDHRRVARAGAGPERRLAVRPERVLSRFFERALSAERPPPDGAADGRGRVRRGRGRPAGRLAELIEPSYLESARLLGRRHGRAARRPWPRPAGDPDFAPEPITPLYLRMRLPVVAQRGRRTSGAGCAAGSGCCRRRSRPTSETVLGREDVLLTYRATGRS